MFGNDGKTTLPLCWAHDEVSRLLHVAPLLFESARNELYRDTPSELLLSCIPQKCISVSSGIPARLRAPPSPSLKAGHAVQTVIPHKTSELCRSPLVAQSSTKFIWTQQARDDDNRGVFKAGDVMDVGD